MLKEPRVDWTIFPDVEMASVFLQETRNKESLEMSQLSNLIQSLIRNNKGIGFLEIAKVLVAGFGNADIANITNFREQLSALVNIKSSITTYLPKDAEFIYQFKDSIILYCHFIIMTLGHSFIHFSIFQTTCIINLENGQLNFIK